MSRGRIVKALSGFYYVLPHGVQSRLESDYVQCRARGIFKKNKVTPLVGDRVAYEVAETGEGTVTEIDPRTSELVRPPIANVTQAVLVFSLAEPALNLQLLDKFLVHVECAGLESVLVFTKEDLLDDEGRESAAEAVRMYESIGYPVIVASTMLGKGVDAVREWLGNAISVFSGQSGVGKSTLLNAVIPGLRQETNEISMKLGRGKHTTRHVELLPLPEGGWVADTPGFSQLEFAELEAEQLGSCFREFAALAEACRFRGCLHHHEPGCKVREAVELGKTARSRYENYLQFLTEIKERKRRY